MKQCQPKQPLPPPHPNPVSSLLVSHVQNSSCPGGWIIVLFLLKVIFNQMALTLHHYGLLTATDSLTNVHCGNMFLAIMTEQPTKCSMCELLAFVFTLGKWAVYGHLKHMSVFKLCLERLVEFCRSHVFFFQVKSTLQGLAVRQSPFHSVKSTCVHPLYACRFIMTHIPGVDRHLFREENKP